MHIPINVGDILSALKLLQGAIEQFGRFSKRDQQRIQKEADHLIELATATEIDRYVTDPRRQTIDQRMGSYPKTAAKKAIPRGWKTAKRRIEAAQRKRSAAFFAKKKRGKPKSAPKGKAVKTAKHVSKMNAVKKKSAMPRSTRRHGH